MKQSMPLPRPPRLGTWLVELFASAEQAESILGDFHEEFSDVVSKSGVLAARRWYWRQINDSIPIASVATSLLIGSVVAALAKGREVVAVLALIVVRSVPFIWLLVFVYQHHGDRGEGFAAPFHFFVFCRVLEVVGILVAGVLVRKMRSVSSPPVTMV